MKHAILLVLALFVIVCAAKQHNLRADAKLHWLNFTRTYNKNYGPKEAKMRYNIFKKNLQTIDKLNKIHDHATFAINKFADMSRLERMEHKMPRFRSQFSDELYKPVQPYVGAIPDAYDWRDKGVITAVKDQGQCGSCWAFSTTEEIESMWILKGNKAVNLSVQQIVDCDGKDGGCDGGDTPTAYNYVIKAGGLETEADYKYTANDGQCSFQSSKVAAKISSWQYVVKRKNETQMLEALASAGPLSICVDAETWDYYDSGVIDKNCAADLDHCVQVVGWGTDAATQKPFWNVRNSWGTDWGEKGYIRIQRDKGNLCGIASEVTVAIV